jgi:tight adherence protein C
MNSVLLPLAAAALVFAAILVLSLSFVGRQDRERVRRSLALVLREGPRGIADVDDRDREWIWPIRSQLLMVGNHLIGDRTRTRLRRHLAWAGTPTNEALVSMIERKAMLLIAGICVGLILGMAYGGTFWLAVPGLGLVGFFLPDLLVFNAGQARTNEIEMGLPDALDLLDLCVSSGLGLEAALSRIASFRRCSWASHGQRPSNRWRRARSSGISSVSFQRCSRSTSSGSPSPRCSRSKPGI